MKVPSFWVLFVVVGTVLIYFNFSSFIAGPCLPDLVSSNCGDSTIITISRKLKENRIGMRSNKKNGIGDVTVDDYPPNDPVPGSMIVHPAPIYHLPYFLPKPPPHAPSPRVFP